ncbi:MAG: tryptophan synthase subunit alpha [Dehalococcoidales bacterium]
MSRIESVFTAGHRPALIAYVTVGYPSVAATLEVVPALAEAGCDIVELGIPFSDPLADGTTIQAASAAALAAGVTPTACLEVAAELRRKVELPLLFMTYYNPVLRFGLDEFCAAGARSGIDGLIVPDLPPDEADDLDAASRQHGLDVVYLLAPTSTEERIRLVARRSRGFIYLVSLVGVTGARSRLSEGLDDLVARVRRHTTMPICVGFGIGTPEQAKRVGQVADGVIVGSRLVQLVNEDTPPYHKVRDFAASLRAALDS